MAVVLLESSGRVFCSGADLSEASTVPMEEGARAIVDLQRQIVTLAKPVVVKLAGPVRAGGIGIVAAADVVIAADDASFALTEVKLGLTPAVISLTVLPRLTSRAAAYTFLAGEVFTGPAAAEMGLVTRSVPAAELDAAVDQVCAELASGAPQGLRETKALLAAELLPRFDERADDLVALSCPALRLGRRARGDDGVPVAREVAVTGSRDRCTPRAEFQPRSTVNAGRVTGVTNIGRVPGISPARRPDPL